MKTDSTLIPEDREGEFLETMFGSKVELPAKEEPTTEEPTEYPTDPDPDDPPATTEEEVVSTADPDPEPNPEDDLVDEKSKEYEELKSSLSKRDQEYETLKANSEKLLERYNGLVDEVNELRSKKPEPETKEDKAASDRAERLKKLKETLTPESYEAIKLIVEEEGKNGSEAQDKRLGELEKEVAAYKEAEEKRKAAQFKAHIDATESEFAKEAGDEWDDLKPIYDNAKTLATNGTAQDILWLCYMAAKNWRAEKKVGEEAARINDVRENKKKLKKAANPPTTPSPTTTASKKDDDGELKLPENYDELDTREGIAALLKLNMQVPSRE